MEELLESRATRRSWPSATPPSFLVASCSAWRWRARSRHGRRCCCSTSRFGALDVQVRGELREWLRRLHEEIHVTTIFVTHDQEEAMDVAGQIVVMNGGRVEQTGTPHELYEHPSNEFVMSFIGPVNRLGDALLRPHDIQILAGGRDLYRRKHRRGAHPARGPPRLRGARRADPARRSRRVGPGHPRDSRRARARRGPDPRRPPPRPARLRLNPAHDAHLPVLKRPAKQYRAAQGPLAGFPGFLFACRARRSPWAACPEATSATVTCSKHLAQVGAQGDPYLLQALGGALVLDLLRSLPAHPHQRSRRRLGSPARD